MIFEQSVLHKLKMETSQSRDSDITGTNCDVIKENLASLSHSDDVIVMYTKHTAGIRQYHITAVEWMRDSH